MSPKSKVHSPPRSASDCAKALRRDGELAKRGSPKSAALPFVFLNVATTADGKLAPANRHFIPFTGKRDRELLLKLRTQADAVMAGARTVDSVPVTLGPGGKKISRPAREERTG